MRVIFLVLGCFFLFGCGMFDNSTYSSPKFANWTGKNIDTLTTAWGRPDRITTAWNGNWEYHYFARNSNNRFHLGESRTLTVVSAKGANVGVNLPTHETHPELTPCAAVFQANPRNIILSVREEGVGCSANPEWPHKV